MSSCADKLDLTNPDQYDAKSFWNKEADFTGNITSMNNYWRANFDQYTLFLVGELRTDYYWPEGSLDGSGLNNLFVTRNQITHTNTQLSDYINLYKMIDYLNTYLYYDGERGEEALTAEARNYMLGMVYGMRAWCYFQIHKIWGTGPLRESADVVLGNYDDTALKKPQATVSELVSFIKQDLDRSLQYFNAGASYNNSTFKSNGGQIYWSKAATEMLAGEVYIWTGKVSTGDFKAVPADVTTAKQYFLNVLNYGYKLMPSYENAVNTNGAANTERIFGTYYGLGEASTNWFNYIMWDNVTGGSIGNYWCCVDADGVTPTTTGSRLTYTYNPGAANVSVLGATNTFQMQRMSGQNRYSVRNAYYYQFDAEDTRTSIFMPVYRITDEESTNNILNIENFDFDAHQLAGCFVIKYRGQLNTGTNRMDGTNYMTYYRLPLVYAYLAEIANYEGDNGGVEHYINLIRERAYGDNWDEATYGYSAGSFLDNEVAILQEKTKEFFQEGQRWWDLRRMTAVKDGTDADHLVFRPEGCIGYGLDLAAHPDWMEMTPMAADWGDYTIETNTPVLDYSTQAHLVLWPLNQSLLNNDETLKQTPGYTVLEGQSNW